MSSKALSRSILLALVLGSTCFLVGFTQNETSQSAAKQIKLSEILIPLSPSATADEVASGEKEAQAIADQLKTGVSFEQLAREHSKGPTAAQGGNIGYFPRGVLAPGIEKQVFNLNVGAVTRPIRTKQGLAILRVTDISEDPANNGRGAIDILTDTEGIDFGPYLRSAMDQIRKNWYDLIPAEAKAPSFKQGLAIVTFSIRKDGTIDAVRISSPSGDYNFDDAASNAVKNSSPLAPLPAQFTKPALSVRLRFFYNPNRGFSNRPGIGLTEPQR